MHFSWAKIRNVRLLRDQAVVFHPELNFIVGENGAGKTTVLECLQILSRGSSSRGRVGSVVSHGEKQWSIRAGIDSMDAGLAEDRVQIRWSDRLMSVSINDRVVSLAELARRIPLLSITPHSHRLLEEGPGLRRRYLDWGVFHMEQQFYPTWRRMMRAMSQRNAAIRSTRRAADAAVWNNELVATAELLTLHRTRYVNALEAALSEELRRMGDTAEWTLRLNPGWKIGRPYGDVLEAGIARDLKQGFTVEGPHRAELEVLQADRNVKAEISRGQQKLLIAALILAQGRLYRSAYSESPALLVDDFAAELSETSRRRLMTQLESYPGQKFLTALDPGVLMNPMSAHAMFHVEHGRLTRLN
jgi:DNA replication and repair protein RecF